MLERYEMPFLDSAVDSFKWAVEEKLEAGYTRQDPNTPTTLPLAISLPLHSGSSRLNRPRVMVKHIITQADTGVLDSWLEDVAFAFSQSLETLTARDDVSNSHLQGILGTQWNLPRLRQLEIQRRRRSVHFDTGALVHSPLLEELVLRDHPTYLNEIDWDTVALQEPLRLSKLRVLRLKGIPAITFHPHSFLTSRDVKDDGDYPGMPDLHTLSLDVNGSLNSSPTYALTQIATPAPPRLTMERSDVPEGPTTRRAWEMLQDRSLWAWNWDLPHLTVMELRGEFGLYFDMAMLQRTPGLEVLCLDIWSRFLPPEAQARTLDLSELTIAMGRSDEAEGTQDNGDNNDDRKQMELLVLPRLTHLHLEGPWTIDGQTLKILFTQVMPNLVCISESGCQGFDLREWMKATAKLPKLLSANMRKIKAQDSPLMAIQDFGLRAEEIPSGGGGGVGVDIETLVNVVLKIKSSMELSILTNWWPLVDRQQALKERGVVEYLFGGSVFTRARHGGRFP
ncbi:hypothetical protein EC991_009246 [Linnemannia zychae]|nr:hypothetical protein EC991_009246 [Linnemannia zychae]